MKALQKLVDRCNEMDITEQINCLGDASTPYQAKMEFYSLRAALEDIAQASAHLDDVRMEETHGRVAMLMRQMARNALVDLVR